MEIGSEFHFEREYKIGQNNSFNNIVRSFHSIDLKKIEYCGSGRSALKIIINALRDNCPEINKVFFPAFLCESIITPFEDSGFECYFYDAFLENNNMEAYLEETIKNNSLFYIIDYFGYENSPFESIVYKLKSKYNLIILNDITHSIFTDKKNKGYADFYISSLRKWLGIPSGGLVINNTNYEISNYEINSNFSFSNTRYKALKEKEEYVKGTINKKIKFLTLFSKGEKILEKQIGIHPIDDISMEIISNYDFYGMIEKRRKNYLYLLSGLEGLSDVMPLHKKMDANICPIFFVLRTKRRDELQKYLIDKEIFAPIHWPKPGILINNEVKINDFAYNELLSIPCDQRYNLSDMERIIKVINQWGD